MSHLRRVGARERATLRVLLMVTWVVETWSRARYWRIVTKSDIVGSVERYVTADRLVLVSAAQLDDLLELSRLAAERIPDPDPLRAALVGSISALRLSATIEP